MSLFSKVGLAMIPSAYKTSKVYSVLPNDADGDFDFARNSTATRVNENGLIETVGVNVPRLNYPIVDGVVSKIPHLLLEPARENVITYSEDFRDTADAGGTRPWIHTNLDVTVNQTNAPDGSLTADLITATIDSGYHALTHNLSSPGVDNTLSVFVKANTSDFVQIASASNANQYCNFNVSNGIVGSYGSGTNGGEIINYGNGWYRCICYFDSAINLNGFYICLTRSISSAWLPSFSGNEESVYLWGAQAELNSSYATSYFPTAGGTQAERTRAAETCTGAGTSEDFNDAEGVLFVEAAALANDGTDRVITISDDSNSNRITFYFSLVSDNRVGWTIRGSNTTSVAEAIAASNLLVLNKFAVKWKVDDFALWMNGVEIDDDLDGVAPINLSIFKFAFVTGANPFYGKVKQTIVFKEALTDAELEKLTSWDSFTELATELDYKIHS